MTDISEMPLSIFAGLVRLSKDGCVEFESWKKLAEEVGVPRHTLWKSVKQFSVDGAVKHYSSYQLRLRDERSETAHQLKFTLTPEFRVIQQLAEKPVGYQVDPEGTNEAEWAEWLDKHFEVDGVLGILEPYIEEGVVKAETLPGKKVYQTLALQSA